MNTIWSAVNRFFGTTQNDRFAALIKELAEIGVECAAHFKKTAGRDLEAVVAFEHRADKVVDEIHELLDNAFILRFDVADAMTLADEFDNVVDGLRKVAIHLDIYKGQIRELPPDVVELIDLGEAMNRQVRDMAAMLSDPRLDLGRVRELANAVDEGESKADRLVATAERRLVEVYSPASANRLEFLAWQKLYSLLEQVTDDANHCAKLILSLARKES